MLDVRFDRQFRTPYSEGYFIIEEVTRIGVIELHFTGVNVHATLILERELERADIVKLIEQIDDDLVMTADTPREDLLVSVYSGKDIGFYNDDIIEEESDYLDDDIDETAEESAD